MFILSTKTFYWLVCQTAVQHRPGMAKVHWNSGLDGYETELCDKHDADCGTHASTVEIRSIYLHPMPKYCKLQKRKDFCLGSVGENHGRPGEKTCKKPVRHRDVAQTWRTWQRHKEHLNSWGPLYYPYYRVIYAKNIFIPGRNKAFL